MRKYLFLLAAATLPLGAMAADKSPDEGFYEDAAEAGLAEVATGKLAQTKGASPAVKEFAAMMVKDHSAANAKLKAIADAKGIKLPTEPGLKHKAKKEMLEHQDGADFDKGYIDGQIKDHEETAALLEKEIANGKDPEAKAFARETLPKVQAHLKAINAIKAGHSDKH